mgnify:CR=1 FL=1
MVTVNEQLKSLLTTGLKSGAGGFTPPPTQDSAPPPVQPAQPSVDLGQLAQLASPDLFAAYSLPVVGEPGVQEYAGALTQAMAEPAKLEAAQKAAAQRALELGLGAQPHPIPPIYEEVQQEIPPPPDAAFAGGAMPSIAYQPRTIQQKIDLSNQNDAIVTEKLLALGHDQAFIDKVLLDRRLLGTDTEQFFDDWVSAPGDLIAGVFGERAKRLVKIEEMRKIYLQDPSRYEQTHEDAVFVEKFRQSLREEEVIALSALGLDVHDYIGDTANWRRSGIKEWGQLEKIGAYIRNYQDSYIVPKQSEYAARVLDATRDIKQPLNPLSREGLDEIAEIAAGERVNEIIPLHNAVAAPSKGWLTYQAMSYFGTTREYLLPADQAATPLVGQNLRAALQAYENASTEGERVKVAADYIEQLVSPAPNATTEDLAYHKQGLLRLLSKNAAVPRSQWSGAYTSVSGVPIFPVPDALYSKALDVSGQRDRIDLEVFLKTMDPYRANLYLSGQAQSIAKLIDMYGGATRPLVGSIEEVSQKNLGASAIEQYSEIGSFLHNISRSPDLIHLPSGPQALELASVLSQIENFKEIAPILDATIKAAREEQGRYGKIEDALLEDAFGIFVGPLVFTGSLIKDVAWDLPKAVASLIPADFITAGGAGLARYQETEESPSQGYLDRFVSNLKESGTAIESLLGFAEYVIGAHTNARNFKDRWADAPLSMATLYLMPAKRVQKFFHKTSALGLVEKGVPYVLSKTVGATTGWGRGVVEKAAAEAGVEPDVTVGVVEKPREYAKTYLDDIDEFIDLRLDEQVSVLQKSGPIVAAEILGSLETSGRTMLYTKLGFSLRRGLDKIFEKTGTDLDQRMLTDYYSDLLDRLRVEGQASLYPGVHKNYTEVGYKQNATGDVVRQFRAAEEQFGPTFKERIDATESGFQRETIWDLNKILDNAVKNLEDLGYENSQSVLDNVLIRVQQELVAGQGGQVPDVTLRLSTTDGPVELSLAEWLLTSESVLRSKSQARSILNDLLDNRLDPENYRIKIKRIAEDGTELKDAPSLTLEDLRLVRQTPEGNYVATNKLKELIESSTETLLDGAAPEAAAARVDVIPSISVVDQTNGLQWLWKNSDGPIVAHSPEAWTAARPKDLQSRRVSVTRFEGKSPEEVARLKQQEVEIKQLNRSIDYKYSADDFKTFARQMRLKEVFATGDETVVALAQEALGEGFEVRKTTTKSLVETEPGFFTEKTNTVYYLENVETGRAALKTERALRDVLDAADEGSFIEGVYDLRQNDLGGLFYKAGRSKEALQVAATIELLARRDHARSVDSIKNSEALRRLERGDSTLIKEVLGEDHFNALERIAQNGIYPLLHRATQMLSPYALEGFMYYLKHERLPGAVKPDSAVVQSWANAGLWDIRAGKPTVFGRAASLYRLRYANDWYESLFTRAVMDNAPKHGGPQGAFFSYKNLLGDMDPALIGALEPYISDIQTMVANDVAMHRNSGLYEGSANAGLNMLTYWRMEWKGTYKEAMTRYGSILKNEARASVLKESIRKKLDNNEELTRKERELVDFVDQAAEVAGQSNNVGLGLSMAEGAFLTRSFLKYRMKTTELFAEGVSKGLVRVGIVDELGNSAPPGPSKHWVAIESIQGVPDHAQRAIIQKYAPDLVDPATGNLVAGAKLYATKAYADLFEIKNRASRSTKEAIYRSANETPGSLVSSGLAQTVEALAEMGESMMATEFVNRVKKNKLFRGATGGSVRNFLFALSSYIAQDPMVVASRPFREAMVAYTEYMVTGVLPKDPKMRAYIEFARSEGIVQEVFMRESGETSNPIQGTRLAGLKERVNLSEIELRKKERQRIASKDALTEAQRKNDQAEIKRLEQEIALIEEGMDILVLDEYTKTFTESLHASLEHLMDPSGQRTAGSFATGTPAAALDVVESVRSAGMKQINKHIGRPLRKINPLLDDMMKHLATGGAEINDRFTKVMAQTFVAGDDMPRFAYGYAKFDEAVRAGGGNLNLPGPAKAKVRRATMEKAPDYTRTSNALKGMRVLDMWAFFPWKQAKIAARLVAEKPHLAAFWMYQYEAWNADALQDLNESFSEVLNVRPGYGRTIPGPYGPLKGDFFNYLPSLGSDTFTNSIPVQLWDIGSSIVAGNESEAIEKWVRLTTGGAQINPEATAVNAYLALTSNRFKDAHHQVLAGGRHAERLRDAAALSRHRKQDVGIMDALASAFLSYEPVRDEPFKQFYSELGRAEGEARRVVGAAKRKRSFPELWESISGGMTSPSQREKREKTKLAAQELLKYPETMRGLVVWVHSHNLHRNKAWSRFVQRFERLLKEPAVKEALEKRGQSTDIKTYFPFTKGRVDELPEEQADEFIENLKPKRDIRERKPVPIDVD